MEEIIALMIPIVGIVVLGGAGLGGLWIVMSQRTRTKELEVRKIEALARLVDASAKIGSLPLPEDQRDAVEAEIGEVLDKADAQAGAASPVPMRVEKEL